MHYIRWKISLLSFFPLFYVFSISTFSFLCFVVLWLPARSYALIHLSLLAPWITTTMLLEQQNNGEGKKRAKNNGKPPKSSWGRGKRKWENTYRIEWKKKFSSNPSTTSSSESQLSHFTEYSVTSTSIEIRNLHRPFEVSIL